MLDVPLYAPVAMRSAVAWMVSSFASSVLDADAYAWQPYSILLSISALYNIMIVFLSAPNVDPVMSLKCV